MNDWEAVEFLKSMLSIYSPSGEEEALARYLADSLEKRGLKAYVDDVGNVIASFSKPIPHEPELIFLGHIDTVPGFIPVREEGGKIFGRGAVDAKGPLAAFLVAMLRVKPEIPVVFVGAVGEEAESIGAKHAIPRFRPKNAVIGEPGRWEGITLGYKGRLTIRYTLSKPKAHTAAPSPTAPEEAFLFWQELKAWAEEFNHARNPFERVDLCLTEIRSQSEAFSTAVEMELELRLPPGLDPSTLTAKASSLAKGASLEFSGEEKAFVAQRNNRLVRAFLRAIRAEGGTPRFKLKSGTSDMNLAGPSWQCPILAYGPGNSSLDHTPWEHIEIEDYLKAVKVWERVLKHFSGGRNETLD